MKIFIILKFRNMKNICNRSFCSNFRVIKKDLKNKKIIGLFYLGRKYKLVIE